MCEITQHAADPGISPDTTLIRPVESIAHDDHCARTPTALGRQNKVSQSLFRFEPGISREQRVAARVAPTPTPDYQRAGRKTDPQ